MTRVIGCRVYFDWDFNGTFTNETSNLISASGEMEFSSPQDSITSGSGIIDACSILLHNNGGRYSAFRSDSAIVTYVQNGNAYHVPVRVDVTVDGSVYSRVFTGVAKIPSETGRTYKDLPVIEFECRSVEERIVQNKYSSSRYYMALRYDEGWTESQIIEAYLEAAGITDHALDAGMFIIPWSWVDDESILEQCWELAAACGGRLYWDRNGVARYENAAHWIFPPHNTYDQLYTNADWELFSVSFNDKDLYNRVSVEYAPREISGVTVLWEPTEVLTVPANSTIRVTAKFKYPAYSEPVVTWKAHTLGGTDMTSSVSLSATHYAQRSELVITNNHATLALRVNPINISARAVMGGPTVEVEKDSATNGSAEAVTFFTTRLTDRVKSYSGNFYVQSKAQADMLAQFLLDRYELPTAVYELNGVPGNPLRVPGDRIRVQDVSSMSAARDAIVLRVSWTFSDMAYVQNLTAIDAANLYEYLGATPGYFIIGTNKLGASDPLRGRIFY